MGDAGGADRRKRLDGLEGAQLAQGSIQVTKLTGDGKRLIARARGQGEARVMLDVVDRSIGGAARAAGFDPNRLSGQGVVDFMIGRSLDEGTLFQLGAALEKAANFRAKPEPWWRA